jgi:hypothetical protein
MQIKRLLDDREVLVGDRVFGAQGRSNSFVEHSGGELIYRPVIILSQPRQYIR